MSVILVVETDASYAQRISEAMQTAGLPVEVCEQAESAARRAAVRPPRLIVASAAVPDVRPLLARFARAQGGPGAVVMIPTTLVGRVSAHDYHADEILPKPFTSEEVRQVLLPMLADAAAASQQLNSAEIFGDILTEMEAKVPPAAATPKAASEPASASPATASASPAAASAPTPAPPRPHASSNDIDRKLEETLSGVLPDSRRRPGAAKPRKATRTDASSKEIDALLDKTLSSLELPKRARKRPGGPGIPASPSFRDSGTVRGAARPAPPAPPAAAPEAPPPPMAVPDVPLPATVPDMPPPAAVPHPAAAPDVPPPAAAPDVPPPAAAPDVPPPPAAAPETPPSMAVAPPTHQSEAAAAVPPAVEAPELKPSAFATTMLPSIAQNLPEPTPSEPVPRAHETMLPSGNEAFELEAVPEPVVIPELEGSCAFEDVPAFETAAEPTELPLASPDPLPPVGSAAELPPSANLFTTQDGAPAPAETDQFHTRRLNVVAPRESAEGEVFGDYTLIRRIALGGMAEVWQARRRGVEGFQKTVAIKKILSHLTGSSDFVTMFIDEAKLAAQLNHNNIIQIYDLGKVGEDFFIAMEYVDGMDLRTILNTARDKRRPLPMVLALTIASSVARALDYAHRKRDFDNRALGLVHRDVSPQNILISYEGEIKLCDFGIVKAVAKASTTQMGALKGKLQYMSPEQAWGKPVDARSDIFSLGSVLFEMLTDTRLFAGDSEIGVLDAVRECRVRSPRELVPEIPEEVDRIVRRVLTQEPEERYQTAGELEDDLKGVIVNLKPMPSQGELARYMQELRDAPEVTHEEAEVTWSPPEPVSSSFQSSAASPSAETPASVEGPSAFFAASESSEAAAPAIAEPSGAAPEEVAVRQSSGSEKKGGGKLVRILLAAILVLAIGAAAAFYFLRPARPTAGGANPTPPVPAALPPPPAAVEPEPAADLGEEGSPAETPGSVASPASETGGEPVSAEDDAVPAGDAAVTTGEDTPAGSVDLMDLVSEEMARQKEEMEKKLAEEFEARRKQLERELEKAKKAAEEGGEGGSGDA